MKRPKDIYVMRVNGDWGAILPRQRHNVIFNADKDVSIYPESGSITLQGDYAELNFVVSRD